MFVRVGRLVVGIMIVMLFHFAIVYFFFVFW